MLNAFYTDSHMIDNYGPLTLNTQLAQQREAHVLRSRGLGLNSLEWGMLWAKYKTMAVQEFKAWLKEEQVYKLHIEEMAAIRRFELMLERRDRFELPIVTASVVIDILSLLEHYDAGIKEVSVRVVSV